MQLETGHPICSLCKRELTFSFEGGPGTKLCEGCRGLIQTAFHGPEPRAVAASSGLQQSGVATYVQSDASNAGLVERSSPAFFEDLSTFADVSEQNHNAAFSDMDDGFSEVPFEDEPSAVLDVETNSLDAPVVESTEHHEETVVATNLSTGPSTGPSTESIRAELSDLHLSLSDDRNPNEPTSTATIPELAEPSEQVPDETPDQSNDESPDQSNDESPDESEDTQAMSAGAVADPWEEPLPAWDYSRNEWPVLMGPPRGRSFAKFKIPFALLMIFAFGAGFYYFIYPQISRDQPPPTDSVPLGLAPEPRDSTPKPADSTAQSQAPSTPSEAPANVEAQPSQQAARDAAAASEIGNTKGRFALQAAAFPTQAGADEFAEKLKAAGVPSYVVSADLARRGRWFRVRVGRFNTAEDAQRFAAEAQLRAKAAGMSLQLIVSQYEQP
jgi:cell division septation protein DedD